MFKKLNGTIDSFEIVTLHTSGMRYTMDTEFVMKDGMAELSQYSIIYLGGDKGTERRLDRRAVFSEEEALKLMNDCKLLSWDGFDGPHPKHVLDGIMFNLKARVNGDTEIEARGSENFPKGYRNFTDGIYQLFQTYEGKDSEK